MDGTSYFPSLPEMQRGLETFAQRTGIRVRHGCRWESTRRAGEDFVLTTSDGEYRAPVIVFAVGVSQPYRPPIRGLEAVPHYGDFRPVETYKDRRGVLLGEAESWVAIATGPAPPAPPPGLGTPTPGQDSS